VGFGLRVPKLNENELIKEFIRVNRDHDCLRILVHEISWHGPNRSVSEWNEAARLKPTAKNSEINKKIKDILQDVRYFAVCLECGERKSKGLMHDEAICQSCAIKNHGVVY
jgi:hypothetical protein